MRLGMVAAGLLAHTALSAHAQGSAKLAVGPDAAEGKSSIACKTASFPGERLTTVGEAITAAYPPPADPFTVASKTPPGPSTKTLLFRIGTAANSVWYVDEETFDPAPTRRGWWAGCSAS